MKQKFSLSKYLKLLIIISVVVLLFLLIREKSNISTLFRFFSEEDGLKAYVLQYGALAPLVFFVLQVIQVIVSPIPGQITLAVGGSLFGLSRGLLLNFSAIIVGSIIAFLLARLFGKPLVVKFVGADIFNRYARYFNPKYIISLFLVFLFPFFPDDALCFLAGISTLPFFIFLLLIMLGRFPGVLIATLVGAELISLTPVAWVMIGIFFALLLVLVIKYHQKIENWLYHRILREEGNDTEDSKERH